MQFIPHTALGVAHVRLLVQACMYVDVQGIPDDRTGRYLEWTYHVIFGEPWMMTMPDERRLCPKDPDACLSRPF